MKIILQPSTSSEYRSIKHMSALLDDIQLTIATYDSLVDHTDDLKLGAMPVGSVEYVQHAMDLAGIKRPAFRTYPFMEDEFLYGRRISVATVHHAIEKRQVFVKPVTLKAFTGFVYNGPYHAYEDFEKEQMQAFMELDRSPTTQFVYCSKPVKFIAEWRLYITKGKFTACTRYDDNPEEYELPTGYVMAMLKLFQGETLALDLGLIEHGRHVIVEANDAWAIGKYQGISPKDYLTFLQTRWAELFATIEDKTNV
jgi:hypothetical protein